MTTTTPPIGTREAQALRATRAQALLSREQVVARLFDAFGRRDLADAIPLLHPDVSFQPMTAQVTRAGRPYTGHDGIRRYLRDVCEQWQELTLHPTQIRAAGNAAVALGLVSGRGKAGSFRGVPTTWMFKFRDDLVWQVKIFSDTRHVLEALGEVA